MEIQAEKERIYRIIDQMPESKAREVIALVDDIDNDPGAPESVTIHNREELINGLQEAFDDIEHGRVRPWRDAMNDIRKKCFGDM